MDKTTEMDILIEKRKKSESTKQYLYRNLRKNIIYNRLKPGDFISEKNIAEVFAVSRTPIREAKMCIRDRHQQRTLAAQPFPRKSSYGRTA